MTMREDLAQWRDWDEAAMSYGIAIGVFDFADHRQMTRVLLSDNPLGRGLHAGMLALVEAGVVERRTEPDEQFRWVFTGTDGMPDAGPRGAGLDLPELPELPADQSPGDEPPARQAPADHPSSGSPRRWWRRG